MLNDCRLDLQRNRSCHLSRGSRGVDEMKEFTRYEGETSQQYTARKFLELAASTDDVCVADYCNRQAAKLLGVKELNHE